MSTQNPQGEGGAQEAKTPQKVRKPVTVHLAGGREAQFVPQDDAQEALAAGYMKGRDYTQKAQDLAGMRRDLERREAEIRAREAGFQSFPPRMGLGGGYGGSLGPLSGATVGGERPVAGPTYLPQEQLYGRAAGVGGFPPPSLQEADLSDPAELQRYIENRFAHERAALNAQLGRVQEQQAAIFEEQRLDGIARETEGFDRNAIEDVMYVLPQDEQAMLAGMPKSAAYEYVYWKHVRPTEQPATVQAGTQRTALGQVGPQGGSQLQPPIVEGTGAAMPPVKEPLDLSRFKNMTPDAAHELMTRIREQEQGGKPSG